MGSTEFILLLILLVVGTRTENQGRPPARPAHKVTHDHIYQESRFGHRHDHNPATPHTHDGHPNKDFQPVYNYAQAPGVDEDLHFHGHIGGHSHPTQYPGRLHTHYTPDGNIMNAGPEIFMEAGPSVHYPNAHNN